MCTEKHIPLYRFIGSITAPILYFVVFSMDSIHWVEDDEFYWGLWKCRNISSEEHPQTIAPGDSPDYYEAVRTMSCFVLIFYILFFFTFDPNKGLGEEYKPVHLAWSTVFLLTIVLGLVGGYYEHDERWEMRNPKLGWCFYVAVASGAIALLTSILMFKQARMNAQKKVTAPKKAPQKKAPPKKAQVEPKPKPKPTPEKKPDPKPVTPPQKPDTKPVTPPQKTDSQPAGLSPVPPPDPWAAAALESSPNNDLSPYNIPADPGLATPDIPDYHVTVEGGGVVSPPPVAHPPPNSWRRTLNFLKDYAKNAVGRGKAYQQPR